MFPLSQLHCRQPAITFDSTSCFSCVLRGDWLPVILLLSVLFFICISTYMCQPLEFVLCRPSAGVLRRAIVSNLTASLRSHHFAIVIDTELLVHLFCPPHFVLDASVTASDPVFFSCIPCSAFCVLGRYITRWILRSRNPNLNHCSCYWSFYNALSKHKQLRSWKWPKLRMSFIISSFFFSRRYSCVPLVRRRNHHRMRFSSLPNICYLTGSRSILWLQHASVEKDSNGAVSHANFFIGFHLLSRK